MRNFPSFYGNHSWHRTKIRTRDISPSVTENFRCCSDIMNKLNLNCFRDWKKWFWVELQASSSWSRALDKHSGIKPMNKLTPFKSYINYFLFYKTRQLSRYRTWCEDISFAEEIFFSTLIRVSRDIFLKTGKVVQGNVTSHKWFFSRIHWMLLFPILPYYETMILWIK